MDFDNRFITFFMKPLFEIEQELRLANGTLKNYRNGKTKNPKKLIFALRNRGLNSDYFLKGEGSPYLSEEEFAEIAKNSETEKSAESGGRVFIPLIEQKASAGFGAELLNGGDEMRNAIRLPEKLKVKGAVALAVEGDSMTPTLNDGDIVVCDTGGWSGDGIYIIRTQGHLYIKRVVQSSSGFQVISDNPKYPPYIAEETEIIGRVRGAIVVF